MAGPTMTSRIPGLATYVPDNTGVPTPSRRIHPYDRQAFATHEIHCHVETMVMAGQHFMSLEAELKHAESERRQDIELLQLKIMEQEDQLTEKEDQLTGKINLLTEKGAQLQEQKQQLDQLTDKDAQLHEQRQRLEEQSTQLTELREELAELRRHPDRKTPDVATSRAVAHELNYIRQLLTSNSYRITGELLQHRATSQRARAQSVLIHWCDHTSQSKSCGCVASARSQL